MNVSATCPPESVLNDFGLGKLGAERAEAVRQHIEACQDCRQRVASLSGDSFVGRLRQAGSGAQPVRRQETYLPGESLANAASSTDGSSVEEGGLPRPSRQPGAPRPDGPGAPSSIAAPPELTNHPDYELIKELGQGGMGTVYLARNRMMDRPEVLKVISKSLLDRPGALERFQQEIRSAAKLTHSNIVAAYSVLRPGDLLVFAMEYVRGQDLAEVVKQRGPLPVANAAFYIHQVANGLQHAFEKGMVHRDIKPNNLMLTIDGKKHVVKILDFGLAKATSEKGAEAGLTKSGQMLGTPDYVAPEQTLAAHKADIRADIYSLGCTLYFLLSGGPPFQEASLFEILKAHHERDARPLNLLRPDVPAELAAVVARMMAKDPTKRYQTPIEVAKALVLFFKPGQAQPSPVNPQPGEGQQRSETETEYRIAGLTLTPPTTTAATTPSIAVCHVAVAPQWTANAAGESGISVKTCRPTGKRRGWWSSLPPWKKMTAILAASAASVVLLGVVLLLRTPHGTIEIELSDPKANVTVTVDGNHIDIAGLNDRLSLDVGEHELKVKGAGYETTTRQFKVTRGRNAPLAITLVPTSNVGPEETAKRIARVNVDPSKRFPCEIPETSRNEWSIDGDELVRKSAQSHATVLFGDSSQGDYDFAVEAKMVSGHDLFALHFGYVSEAQFFFYGLGASSNRRHDAGRCGKDGYQYLGLRQAALSENRWHRAEVRVRGHRCECFLDDERLFVFTEPGLHNGRLGLHVNASYRFRNIIVKRPSGEVLLHGLPDLEAAFALSARGANEIASASPAPIAPEKSSGVARQARSGATAPTTARAEIDADGWTSLFNGKDLSGWKTHPKQPGNWRVENGVLIGSGPKLSHLFSERGNFTNFHLRLEARCNESANSGALCRTQFGPILPADNPLWLDGYEVEINVTGYQMKTGTLTAGGTVVAAVTQPPVGPMQWFQLEILANGNHIIVKINGQTTADYVDTAYRFPMGHLALQQCGPATVIEFRKIEIKESGKTKQ